MHFSRSKRLISLLLTLVLALSLLAPAASAAASQREEETIPVDDVGIEESSAQVSELLEANNAAAEAEPEEKAAAEAPAQEPEKTEAAPEETEAPAERSATRAGTAANEGRSYAGQVLLTVDGTDFILIGTKQQLAALDYYPTRLTGNNADALTEAQRYDVTGPIWCVTETKADENADWAQSDVSLVYPGDADLTGAYANYHLYGETGYIWDGTAGVTSGPQLGQRNVVTGTGTYTDFWGTHTYDNERKSYYGGTLTAVDTSITSYDYGKYSPRNNYVVFRSFSIEDLDWVPLMFYGLMYGAEGSEMDITLEAAVREMRASADYLDYRDDVPQPTISDVTVSTPSGDLDADKYVGVGFFASVTSARPGTDSGLEHIKAEVRNLALDGVDVTNNYTGIGVDQTVVNWLTSGLGTGVGTLLDGLLKLLTGKNTSFADSLNDLLNARAEDPTNLATGGFAGRIYAEVLIENCDISDVQVQGAGSYIGGFVGYSTGETQYDFVSNAAGALLNLLTTVLNIIPGLGLGDLISIVRNVLPLNTLIPVDYLNPHIEDCDVTGLSGNIGPAAQTWSFNGDTVDAICNGGFIGAKVATVMINDGVHDSTYTVNAKEYGGGFAGLARDAVIKELLTDLGVNLGVMQSLLETLMESNIDLQSVQVRCFITGSNVSVRGENYLGGFNGAMANAYCVNNEMQGQGKTLSVVGTGDCVGGFAGIATLGWAMSMGQDEAVGNTSLLSTLKNVVTSLLSSYGDELLSLLGVGQSEILGLQFDYSEALVNGEYVGGEATVEGHDYVGGLVGKADALIMTGTNGANLSKMTYFQNGDLTIWDIFPNMPKNSSFTVTYHEKNGSTASVTVTANDNYTITLPSRSDVGDYHFEGWITTHVDHSTAKPSNILQAGDTYVVTYDVTFNALYSKEGDTAYEIVTRTPDNWETDYENYIITYGRDEATMRVLTGLSDNTNYESASSGGAKTVSEIRVANGADKFTFNGGVITNVPNQYLYAADQVAGTSDYYFGNVGSGTYLRRFLSGTSYKLYANSNRLVAGTQWHPSIAENLNVMFENDLAGGSNKHLAYNTNGYFFLGTAADAEANELYIWGKTKLPTTYTTVDVGVEMPDSDLTITLDSSVVGRFAQIHVNGLRLVNGHKFVGGIAGLAGTANVSGLLNDTLGVADFKKFELNDIVVVGGTAYADGSGNDGLKVWGRKPDVDNSDTGAGYYVGGGVGLAMGGDLLRIDISRLNMVEGVNCVGGFAGCVGPGELLGTGGLNLQLLGLSLLNANNLLSVGQGLETQVQHVNVTGIPDGFTVEATGANASGETRVYCAGGFFGRSNSTNAVDCHVDNLYWVKANTTDGRAGGFIGVSEVGGLASMDDSEGTQIKGLVSAGNLLNAVGYLIPEYTNVDTTYIDGGYVQAGWAGGFAADFQSGTVDNLSKDPLGQNEDPEDKEDPDWFAVYNIDRVVGTRYAGGFGAKVYSGALADAGGGISILGDIDGLSISAANLLNLVNVYVPKIRYAGVKSDNGFTVTAMGIDPQDSCSGAAGGFIGYASGAQVTRSDVTVLKHTAMDVPADLDGMDGSSYFGANSHYAVSAGRYGGGYVGFMDIGSAASVGKGLSVLGNSLSLTDVTSALNFVISTIEHSDVTGQAGGFSVLSNGSVTSGLVGHSGGFAGLMKGGHIQDSNSFNFNYIIGQIAAGGYVGEMTPGSVANALGDTSILGGLVSTSGNLLELADDFVPSIRNSVTTCIPCGGAVRAQAASDSAIQRGMAGGYAGHNNGGQIWGNDDHPWKGENETIENEEKYKGPKSECAAIRILSVFGYEYAGGFTGLMDCADTADTGSLSLLWGLVDANNVLGALSIVYPTEENTATYGPLSHLDYNTWNIWIRYIGQYGGYGGQMHAVENQTELDAMLSNYIYGYTVTAGRPDFGVGALISVGGCAGGYVGAMRSGTVTNGQAHDVKQVKGMRAAGGFAGEMVAGGAANLGSVDLLGLNLDLGQLVRGALDVFVPCVKTSSVRGYQSGMVVIATGDSSTHDCGNAGGYVGSAHGAQIWGDSDESDNPSAGCNVTNLRKVQGTRYVGGYAGDITAGAAADVNTNASDGFMQNVLDLLVTSQESVASVLNATLTTIRNASVSPADPAWGFTVEGYNGTTPIRAGGFAGSVEAAVLGDRDGETNLTVTGLRGVDGGDYAGGFFGLADVAGVANVGNNSTKILQLIQAGQVSLLDAFRPYIYHASVTGVAEGIVVRATTAQQSGVLESTTFSGCAGGFGGALLNGSCKNSTVTNLSSVDGLNYVGGFVGHSGKSGVLDADDVELTDDINLLALTAGALDVFGSHIEDCGVTGISKGYTVAAANGSEPIAGGFAGLGDLSKIYRCTATNLKLVQSDQIAGGFIGKTTMAYLVSAQVSSSIVNLVLYVVNALIRMLYIDEIEDIDLVDLDLGIAEVAVASDGDLLRVELLGLPITVGLAQPPQQGVSNTAQITIGDSYIELPCDENGLTSDGQSNLTVHLFKGNHSNTENCTVTGIASGYDVLAGGATQQNDGSSANGYGGGFVGYNDEGVFKGCTMLLCDVIRGTSGKVGPFSGTTSMQSVYSFNSVDAIEGENNKYSIYRDDASATAVQTAGGTTFGTATADQTTGYKRFEVTHLGVIDTYADLEDAVLVGADDPDLKAYESAAKCVLMLDTPVLRNPQGLVPETADMQDPCERTVHLTINKVWDDLDDLTGVRPAQVTYTIYQYTTDRTQAQVYQTVTLSAANDENAWSEAVWQKRIDGLPATVPNSDPVVPYHYYVEESAVSGYYKTIDYADSNVADKLTYAANDGYVSRTLNQIVLDQVIVVDYGLPVPVSVTEYYQSKYDFGKNNLTFSGLAQIAALSDNTQRAANAAFTTESKRLTYGTAAMEAVSHKLLYTPANMQMTSTDKVAVMLSCTQADGSTRYIYGTVTIVPATIMYYEDSFITFNGSWVAAENSNTLTEKQSEDRPGSDTLDDDNVYGYDDAYSTSTTYSLGSAMMTEVSAANAGAWPTATFTFTGTGFDLIGVTDSTTGFMTVQVYSGTEATGTAIKNWAVDTYYGCACEQDGYVRYYCLYDGERWHGSKTVTETAGTVGTQEGGHDVVNELPSNPTAGDVCILYRPNFVWTASADRSDTIYQIPVISSGDSLEYGTYTVVLTAMYARFFDHNAANASTSYKLYVDAVRIYKPAQNLDAVYYTMDHEGWPQFTELRRQLLTNDDFGVVGTDENDQDVSGAVFMDGLGIAGTISDYNNVGPNNEIYLAPGQAVAFALSCDDAAHVDRVHLSMKIINETYADIMLLNGETELPLKVVTGADSYYDVTPIVEWQEGNESAIIVISNPATRDDGTPNTAIVSMTNLKVTYTQQPTQQQATRLVMRPQLAQRALELIGAVELTPIELDEGLSFRSASVSLSSDFAVNFYVETALLDGAEDCYVLCTKTLYDADGNATGHETRKLTGVPAEELTVFTFRNIAATEMGSELSATLYVVKDGETLASEPLTYSVQRYAQNMLARTDDAALRTLLVDMLNYGALAQEYFSYNTANPVNAVLTAEQQAYGTETTPAMQSCKERIENDGCPIPIISCTLELRERVTILYAFDLSEYSGAFSDLELVISWQDENGAAQSAVVDGANFVQTTGRYWVTFDGLNAAQMRTVCTAELREKQSGRLVSDTVRYSIESYAASKSTDPDALLRELTVAMLRYGDATAAFCSK
ncbi:MAG: Cna B-type domain-containing protein [Oscillospiraceae bacterium]|nr:Cna B-type domain-containing protein [Oscillospiraceae bacterium]